METCCTNLEQKKRGCEWIVSNDGRLKIKFSIEIKRKKIKKF